MLVYPAEAPIPSMRNGKLLQVKIGQVNRIMDIYKELETYSGMTTDPEAHGYHGPISVRQPQHPTTVSETFTQAIIQATGLPFVLDYNDPNTPTGASTQLQMHAKCA